MVVDVVDAGTEANVASVPTGDDSIIVICDEVVGRMRHDAVHKTRARRIPVVSLVVPCPLPHELIPAALFVYTRDFTLELVDCSRPC